MTDWQDKARALVDQLVAAGHLRDERWRVAFQEVPRHVFVPRFWRDATTLLDGADPAARAEWLQAVYSDSSLTTQYAPVPGTDLRWATSSSTKPSLMAHMLEALQVRTGDTVLEIGAGTGYHAALLCHRLGDTHLSSVDIHPDLVVQARQRLGTLGYYPTVLAGDGAHGIAENAPYDRIIATCAVPAIPPAWVDQLVPSGVLVTDVRGGLASSLVVLHKTGSDAVTGRFSTVPGHFMWLRADPGNPLRDGGELATVIDHDGAQQHTTTLDLQLLADPDLRFLLQLTDPTLEELWRSRRAGVPTLHLSAVDGSWVQARPPPRPERDHPGRPPASLVHRRAHHRMVAPVRPSHPRPLRPHHHHRGDLRLLARSPRQQTHRPHPAKPIAAMGSGQGQRKAPRPRPCHKPTSVHACWHPPTCCAAPGPHDRECRDNVTEATSRQRWYDMASRQTLKRRIIAREARLAEIEGGYGDTLYKLHRASAKTDLRIAKILGHLKIEDVTEEDINNALDEE